MGNERVTEISEQEWWGDIDHSLIEMMDQLRKVQKLIEDYPGRFDLDYWEKRMAKIEVTIAWFPGAASERYVWLLSPYVDPNDNDSEEAPHLKALITEESLPALKDAIEKFEAGLVGQVGEGESSSEQDEVAP